MVRVRVDGALEEVHQEGGPWEWAPLATAWQVRIVIAGVAVAVPLLWDCASGRRHCEANLLWPRNVLDWWLPLLLLLSLLDCGCHSIVAKETASKCCCSDRSQLLELLLEVLLLLRVAVRRQCG